jgi:energy-coupling factor transporter ATP-binding protein EcfA2
MSNGEDTKKVIYSMYQGEPAFHGNPPGASRTSPCPIFTARKSVCIGLNGSGKSTLLKIMAGRGSRK